LLLAPFVSLRVVPLRVPLRVPYVFLTCSSRVPYFLSRTRTRTPFYSPSADILITLLAVTLACRCSISCLLSYSFYRACTLLSCSSRLLLPLTLSIALVPCSRTLLPYSFSLTPSIALLTLLFFSRAEGSMTMSERLLSLMGVLDSGCVKLPLLLFLLPFSLLLSIAPAVIYRCAQFRVRASSPLPTLLLRTLRLT
jgi:hypothetical protein